MSSPVTLVPTPGTQRLRARTVEVSPSLFSASLDGADALLDLLPQDEALAWVRRGEGLVAWGVAAHWEFTGQERFSRAQRWWNRWLEDIEIDDPLQLPGTGPLAFASFTFDPEATGDPQTSGGVGSTVVVPRVIIGRREGRSWITVIEDPASGPIDHLELLDPRVALREESTAPTTGDVIFTHGSRTPEEWMSSVAAVIDRIGRGEVDKVVLARDIVAHLDEPVDVRHLLHRLAEDYPECWTFSVAGMVGATPELLVRRTGSLVMSRVLAGTVKRRGDADEDASLAAALLGSGKDLEEHEYAVNSVARALATHCADLDVPSRPRVLRLPNVQHLATDISGQLVDAAPVLALAASLHPTAAVCGTPTERAFSLIREFEGMDRGRYSGPVGWWDSRGDGEFGIALRCAEIDPAGTSLRLFAGCGIVAGSDPESELAESRAKLVPVRDALSGPRTTPNA